MKFINKIVDNTIALLAGFAPIQLYEYCNIETAVGKLENGERYPALLTSNGGYVSAFAIRGVRTLMGNEEHRETLNGLTEAIEYAVEQGMTLDYGFTQDGLGSKKFLDNFFEPKINTAKLIGLDMEQDLRESGKTLEDSVREEWQVLYITSPGMPVKNQPLPAMGEYEALVTEHKPGQPFYGLLAQVETNRSAHLSRVETLLNKIKTAGIKAEILSDREITKSIRKDVTFGRDRTFNPWLWGDDARYRITPEDAKTDGQGMINWSGSVIGSQLHPEEVQHTSGGILCVDGIYVAPLLIEMMPENNSWSVDLLATLPKNLPLRQRVLIQPNATSYHSLAKNLGSMIAFGTDFTRNNDLIVDSFNYVDQLNREGVVTPAIGMVFTTWANTEKEARDNRETLRGALEGWGKAKVVTDRGNAYEAYLSGIPGFSDVMYAAMTLEHPREIAKMIAYSRPSAPFKNGATALKTGEGTLFSFSPISTELSAFIEVLIAGSGSGKSVYQNSVTRDANFIAGNEKIVRHTTIDIGISGKGVIEEIRNALPPSRVNEALYYRMTMSKSKAINPFDLQLGQLRPGTVDVGFHQDFLRLILTPLGQDSPVPFMLEMANELMAFAYEYYNDPETAKLYTATMEPEVDRQLERYPELHDKEYQGRRWTWIKVRDALFERGQIAAAKKAQRQIVPILPDFPQLISKSTSINERYSGNGRNIVQDFKTLVSAACKSYPLLTAPSKIDFDEARYLIIDVAKVTGSPGSLQTAIGYALAMHLGTRDFWMDFDDIDTYDEKYHQFGEELIRDIRKSDLGVTMEEYRRTQSQPAVRSMVNRYAAEGRKNRVRVQVVGQKPDHFDEEILSHATIVTLMGTWKKGDVESLKSKGVSLTKAEEHALMKDLRGPTSAGSSLLMKYESKEDGWCSQVLYLKKSARELWAAVTGERDRLLKEAVEALVGAEAMDILCSRYPKGTAEDAIEREMQRRAELQGMTGGDIYEEIALKIVTGWKASLGSS